MTETASAAARAAGNYVYRALSASDDIARGAQSACTRSRELTNQPRRGRARQRAGERAGERISATKDAAVAVERYGKHGVVRIDLGKVGSRVEGVEDVSRAAIGLKQT